MLKVSWLIRIFSAQELMFETTVYELNDRLLMWKLFDSFEMSSLIRSVFERVHIESWRQIEDTGNLMVKHWEGRIIEFIFKQKSVN